MYSECTGKPSTSGWITALDLYVMLCFCLVFLAFVEFAFIRSVMMMMISMMIIMMMTSALSGSL